MSDIIYTPPASGGGTTINSNNNFIPVRQNATTFVDSLLFSTTTILKSVFSGFDRGLYFDYLNNLFFYGTTSSGMSYINNANQEVSLLSNSQIYANLDGVNNVGYFGGAGARLNFNGNSNICNIGDGNGNFNGTYLEVDDLNQLIRTNLTGLKLDILNKEYWLGDYNSIGVGTHLKIDDLNQFIATYNNGNSSGISLDFINVDYFLGDFSGIQFGTHIRVKDGTKQIVLFTSGGEIYTEADLLTFSGALTSGSASGSSGQHLQVTINGTPYKIKLENP
jgi:hypothetical protein